MLAQLWERDEEFPARASFLFDSTAGDHLMVDAILVALGHRGQTSR